MLNVQADQQYSFPTAASARVTTGETLNCVCLCATGTSCAVSSCDDPDRGDEERDNEDGMGFLDDDQMIRDCDELIEAFMVDKPALSVWRALLVFNKNWSNIRLQFFRYFQDRINSEDNPLVKKKLLLLGKKLKEVCRL